MNSNFKNIILVYILAYFLVGCSSNNTTVEPKSNILSKIDEQNLTSEYLDKADEEYINLKESEAPLVELKSAAKNLALAHMKVGEHIIANFYLQEALLNDPTDETVKLLLVKNQYLAAKKNRTDISYLKRALKALEENVNIITDSNYKIEASNMLNEVKDILSQEYRNVANYYQKIKKYKATEVYNEKINKLENDQNVITEEEVITDEQDIN